MSRWRPTVTGRRSALISAKPKLKKNIVRQHTRPGTQAWQQYEPLLVVGAEYVYKGAYITKTLTSNLAYRARFITTLLSVSVRKYRQ